MCQAVEPVEDLPAALEVPADRPADRKGGLDYFFVGDIPEDLICGICSKVSFLPD